MEEVPKNVLPTMMDHHSSFVDDIANQLANNDEPKRGHKSWTDMKEHIVRRWQTDIEKASFIFGERLDTISRDVQRIQVCSLAGSSIIGILSVLSLTLAAIEQTDATRWTQFAFSCVSAILAGIIAFYNTRTYILGWNYQIKELSQFVGELNRTWVYFDKELMLPFSDRMNADYFISRNVPVYGSLMERCPDIKADEYMSASRTYLERLANNLIWTKRFRLTTNEALSEIVVH